MSLLATLNSQILEIISQKMSPTKIGLIDGTSFLTFWSVLGCLLGTYLDTVLCIILVFLIPIAIFVVWRGRILAIKQASNRSSLNWTALEGFSWGFFGGVLLGFNGYITKAYAAGGAFTSSDPWENFFAILLFGLAGGIAGMLHGIFFYILNRWLIIYNSTCYVKHSTDKRNKQNETEGIN